MGAEDKDINDLRCTICGLIQPCLCRTEKEFYAGDSASRKQSMAEVEPLVILNKRRTRRRPSNTQSAGDPVASSHYAPTFTTAGDIAHAADHFANISSSGSSKFEHARMSAMHYLTEMFTASPDNKLALKLYGNKAAVMLEQRRQARQNKGVIHPFSTFRWYWDILLICFISMHVILLPVSIAFLSDDLSLHWLILNALSDTIFILDIFLNFRTGIVDPNNTEEVILDKKVISSRYLRGWFVIDFVSSIPFDYAYLIASSTGTTQQSLLKASRALRILKLAKLLSLLRLLRVSRLVRYIKRFEELLDIASGQVRILKLIGCMLLLSHWNGCVQFLVPYLQGFPENSWVVINRLTDKNPAIQYSWSLFNAMSHMLCIGYGRYPPQNVTELWLMLCSMTIGATFYAVFIGIMSGLVMSIDSSGRLYNEKLNQVEEYMRYRKLPLNLRLKVQDFYEHRFHHKLFNEELILSELSRALREEILVHNIRPLLLTVPFFSNASDDFIMDIVARLRFEVFLTGEFICKSGRKGSKMYFIQRGIVDVLTKDNHLATSLGDGSHFGEICLLTKEARRVASVRAATTCNLYSLASRHFHEVLDEYPDMKAMLEEVARERLARIGLEPNLESSFLTESRTGRPAFKLKPRSDSLQSQTGEDEDEETEPVSPQKLPSVRLEPVDTQKQTPRIVKPSTIQHSPPSSSRDVTNAPSDTNGKRTSFLTKAIINTVAPGLASFARPSMRESKLQVVPEQDEDEESEEEDPDVLATIADF